MSNNYNYMDGAMQRPPSNQSQAHQQANGVAAGLNGIDVIPGIAKPGQLMDANHLWRIVEELSAVNEQNRAAQARIDEKALELHLQLARAAQPGGGQQTHGGDTDDHQPPSAELLTLRADNAHLTRDISTLRSSLGSTQSLLDAYTTAFDSTVSKLRTYAYEHTNTIIALHKHYQTLLDVERTQNLEMRLEGQAWQAGLTKVSGLVREAFREVGEGEEKWVGERAGLRRENRVLRRLVGWEGEGEGSSDEEEEGGKEGYGGGGVGGAGAAGAEGMANVQGR